MQPLEVWAGVECTVNRVGDQYFDQLELNGHATRIEDLQLFADLGIKAIRYPILWERIAPKGLKQADWSWADQRLEKLAELGIRVIAGLVHHGSGPQETNLLDSAFPEKLAEFAAAVAERYLWLDAYTPVNEPLTTARFSALYGHWYPHQQDSALFAQALIHECRAVVLSMQAIRSVSSAQLIQTEDLGQIFSTPLLAYQATFENDRRWLTFDLLCGRVTPEHPLWSYLRWLNLSEAELLWFVDHACPPDIIGINRYTTSDRFLDERLERYPEQTHGSNGQHTYADVEAVRVCESDVCHPYYLLQEVWNRYQIPIAITEVHLGCTREEQLRWLQEMWDAAQQLRTQGTEVRAVTAWSLLGAYDWNSLLTRAGGYYEPGVFDLRSQQPRPTALAQMLRHLSTGQEYQHPVLAVPGWWRRPQRLLYPPVKCDFSESQNLCPLSRTTLSSWHSQTVRELLIVGATGTLGQAFARLCEARGIPYRLLSRQDMDITHIAAVDQVFQQVNPWAVINAAGYVRVDKAEWEPELCRRINVEGAANLADACQRHQASYVTFSSDLVFDGNRNQPYVESCQVAPLNIYGASKAIAEERVLKAHACSLVIRTSAFFGPWDSYNFLTLVLQSLKAGQRFMAATDTIISPTYVPDLVSATLDLLIDGECGLWHLSNGGAISWLELAEQTAQLAGLNTALLEGCPSCEFNWIAKRPIYSALSSERGLIMPAMDSAVQRYLEATT